MRKVISIAVFVALIAAIMFTLPIASLGASSQPQKVSPAVRKLQAQMRGQQAAMRAMHNRVADLEAQATCLSNVIAITGYYWPVLDWASTPYNLYAIDFTQTGSTPTWIQVVNPACVTTSQSLFKVQRMQVQPGH